MLQTDVKSAEGLLISCVGCVFSCSRLGAVGWAVDFLWKDVQARSVADQSFSIFLKVFWTIEFLRNINQVSEKY